MQWKRWGYVLGMVGSLIWVAASRGQDVAGRAANPDREQPPLNTWSAAAEFVPTTQDYFLGLAEDRRFFAIGGEYARRLNRRRAADVFYVAELRPLILEGDPTLEGFKNQLTGQPVLRFRDPQRVVYVDHSPTLLVPQNIAVVPFYARAWTYGASSSSTTSRSTSPEVFQALEESGSPGGQDPPQSFQPTQRFPTPVVARDRQQLRNHFCRRPERKRSVPWAAFEIGTRCRMGSVLSKTFVQGCECRTKVLPRRCSWN